MSTMLEVRRGYFALGDHEHVVKVSCTQDFEIHFWARNIETFHGGIQVSTPPSQFRTPASNGPQDGLVMDVPPQTGLNLGLIGGKATESISISNAFGARVTVFLTIVTSNGGTISVVTS